MLGFLPLLWPEVVAPASAFPPYCIHGGPSVSLYAVGAFGPVVMRAIEGGEPNVLESVVAGVPNPVYVVALGPLSEC